MRGRHVLFLLCLPLILNGLASGSQLVESGTALWLLGCLLTRFILGVSYPGIALLFLIFAASFIYPSGIYGTTEALDLAAWVARFGLASVALVSLPRLYLRFHHFQDSLFPQTGTVKAKTGALAGTAGLTISTLVLVLVVGKAFPQTSFDTGQLFLGSSGILTWAPLLLVCTPPVLGLFVYGLEQERMGMALWGLPALLLLAISPLSGAFVLALCLYLVGLALGSAVLRSGGGPWKALLTMVWSSGLAALLCTLLKWEDLHILTSLILAQVAGVGAFRRLYLWPETGASPILGASLRAASPVHWVWDLLLVLLRRIDGPGPVWD